MKDKTTTPNGSQKSEEVFPIVETTRRVKISVEIPPEKNKKHGKAGKILFKSALGYWNNALDRLFNIESYPDPCIIKRVDWNIDFEKFNLTQCEELDSENRLKSIKGFASNDWLYVFVAPITWASRYKNDGFIILGPAFGTKSGLSIFGNKREYKKTTDLDIIIGTIGQYITSTALLRVYHLFMTDIFETNIHLILEEDKEPPNKKKSNFRFLPQPNSKERLENLLSRRINTFDFALFTDEDVYDLKLEKEEVREILKIDPILAHIFNVEVIPRSVYCIHESQINMISSLSNLEKLFENSIEKYNNPMYSDEAAKMYSDIYPINPYDEHYRKVQMRIIKRYRDIIDTSMLSEIEQTNLKDLINKNKNA